MTNNFITISQQGVSLKNKLEKLMTAIQELKFLVGFFYFSGWQEIHAQLQNKNKKPTRLSGFRGTSRDRTRDTWIFSPLLYHLS